MVDALRMGAVEGAAKLYDAYAERLHDYACSLTGERDAAADSVHDALVTAHGCVSRLKETGRLRAWLYALTRFQAAARLAHRSGSGKTDSVPLPVFDEPEDPELAALVHEALGELRRNEREVLELSLRHGLTPAEAGAVLGLTSRQAATRLGRARDHLENAAAAVILARTGRAHCPDLSAMLDSWEGPLTPLLRRRLSGHISGCEVCTEGRHRQVAAARLLDMVPVAYPPISLRRRVVDTCVNPERDQTRTLITDRGDSFDRTGFPVAAERRSRRRRSRCLGPVLLAGAAVLAATGAMVAMNGGDPAKTALRVAPAPSAAPSDSPDDANGSPDDLTGTTPEPTLADDTTPTPDPSPTSSRSGQPSTRPATTATTRPAAAPTATRRQTVRGARFAVSCPDGVEDATKIGLTARNAGVAWSATASAGLEVFPASGSIKAGGSMAIWVTVDDPGTGGSGSVSFRSNGGGARCSLSWQGGTEQTPEPPTDQPTSGPEPSETPRPTQSTSVDNVQADPS
ncbi:RNA polymerase sigma factor [Nonomuraea aurantiaca]|uniref:RNA polymerase sigma factor n=1 Tax=Nonomuraea aurantiaca TaxID=2878562 RepID=UPI001CD9F87C|nr:sigma-70 family RNA polymerase sigma factor [Nonomuraea aurantiaca]MCA2223241.1 sigma-70 family RNA polymerase sigma factor [Nonomuraea aurantiaca]